MRSVLLSIQPKWCELIASGKKTVEVRKTRPKIETPFKCYIYCTSIARVNLDEYANIFRATLGRIDEWHGKVIGEFVCDKLIHYEMEGYGKDLDLYQSIKAVRLDEDGDELWFTIATNEMSEAELSKVHLLKKSCLSFDGIGSYVVGNKPFGFHKFFGWHISDLVIYDEPLDINDFVTEGDCTCEKCKECKYFDKGNGFNVEDDCRLPYEHKFKTVKPLFRPPQSWCYVEGGEQ